MSPVAAPALVICLTALGGTGCAAAELSTAPQATVPRANQAAPRPEQQPRPAKLLDAGWRTVVLDDQQLLVSLPQARSWRAVKRDSWWRVEHAETRSLLEVKRWHQRELVDSSDCENQARLWKPDLERAAPDEVVSRRDAETIAGFRSTVVVFSRALAGSSRPGQPPGEHVLGVVFVFGGQIRSCLALRFRTTARGHGASRIVAERLALVSDKLLPALRRRPIDARVRPQAR